MSDLPHFDAFFKASPSPNLILLADSPQFTIFEVNDAYCRVTRTSRIEMLGKGLFEVFPENPKDLQSKNVSTFEYILNQVITSKELQVMAAHKYDIPVRGTQHFKLKYWSSQNAPILNEQGEVLFIIHSPADITEQILAEQKEKDANEKLVNNQEHYRSLFDNNPDAVFSFDLAGNFLSVNEQAALLAECSREKLMEITFIPLIAPEELAHVLENFKKAGEGEIQNYNTKLITAQGNLRLINVRNLPIIVNGEIVGVYGIAKDLTQSHQVEQDFKQSREQLQKIMDSSLDVICTFDENRRFVKVSKASFKIWGYLPEEIEGRFYMDFIHGKEKDDIDNTAGDLKTNNTLSSFENRYKRKDGKIISMSWSAYWDNEEKLAYCVGRDITASKAATETIKHNEKRFRTLLQNSTDGLALVAADGTFLEISETGRKILGYSVHEMIGLIRPDLIHAEDLDAISEAFTSVIENPETIKCLEFRFLLADGGYKWIQANIQNQLNEAAIGAMVVNFGDITERKNYISAIEDQNQKLREIAWTQSHIVRAPLCRIMGLVNLFSDYPADTHKELLNALSASANELDDVIRDIVKKTQQIDS